ETAVAPLLEPPERQGRRYDFPEEEGHIAPAPPKRDRREEEPRRRKRRAAESGEADPEWGDLQISRDDPGLSIASMIVGIASLVLGVFSLCCCGGAFTAPVGGICGVGAIGLGVVGMKRGGRTYAHTGIALGAVGLLMAV